MLVMSEHKGSLKKRITLLIVIGISVILLSLGIASHYIIQKDIDGLLTKKLALSRITRCALPPRRSRTPAR